MNYMLQVDEFLMRLEKQHSETRNSNHKSTAISPGLKDRSASTAGMLNLILNGVMTNAQGAPMHSITIIEKETREI